jgi:hypothetical protein
MFATAVAAGPEQARKALSTACGGDEEARAILEPLIDEHFRLLESTGTAATTDPATDATGSVGERFHLVTRLGSGTFGDVYRAIDGRTGTALAVKILRSPTSIALEYFKREFRSLADIRHPNIVKLYELIGDDNRWLFSMELVEGAHFLQFISRTPIEARDATLRLLLSQLAQGVQELHNRRLIHRDLKPSNVLVTHGGRVVILDFGLVRPFGAGTHPDMTFVGTPDYIAPEHASGGIVAQSADWYAVGVILYQALTGRLPFTGGLVGLLHRTPSEAPVPPAHVAPNAAPDLCELCLNLLQRDPMARATYDDVMRVATGTTAPPSEIRKKPFVGRAAPLQCLLTAFETAESRPVLVHLSGPSGIGKTVLVREVLERIRASSPALVFAGRCYEGQSVPYQALDDAIDFIAQYLRRLPREELESLLPRNFALLAKMFPVLEQFVIAGFRSGRSSDTVQSRTLALAALREMFGRIAEKHRIVLVIDDLQWGDADGCSALNDLLSAADSPPMLTILAYRSEDIDASPWLISLREAASGPSNRETLFLEIGRLEPLDAEALVRSLLASSAAPSAVQQIVDYSVGNPFLVDEIVRWVNTHGFDQALAGRFSFNDVIRTRLAALPTASRRLLQLLALAGQPASVSVLQAAVGIGDAVVARDELIAARLVRVRVVRGREELEVYHDRLRSAITNQMTIQDRASGHRDLAYAFLAAGSDPEIIATQFERAGEMQLCGRYALEAAGRASAALAFNKAVGFFELALSTRALEPDAERVARRQLGDALANAGRGSKAAEHYLAAARDAAAHEQLALKQRAAEELLHSGHIDHGLTIFEEILRQVGKKLPRPTSVLPVELLLRRGLLALRGLRWRERDVGDIPRDVLLTVDSCAAVATGLALVDIARGATLQTTSLLLALRAGEPTRIARALAMEAGYRSTGGAGAEHKTERILAMAREIADRTGDPRAIGLTAVMAAGCAWNTGRWQECYRRSQAAREFLQGRYERVTWERDTAAIFEVDALRWMGRWSTMKAILPELLEDARARGDLYAEAILQMHGGSCAELANDDPLRARAGLALLERWSNKGFHVEHLVETHNQVEIALYLANGAEAYRLITERWPLLQRSLLLRVQNFRIQMRSIRARAAISAAAGENVLSRRRELLRQAERDVRAMRSERTAWSDALAAMAAGTLFYVSGDHDGARRSFAASAAAANRAGMALHAAVARRAQGTLIGGDEGKLLWTAAENELAAEAIAKPSRLAAVVAPVV